MDITELGVRILFFPVAVLVGLLIIGIVLYVAVNLASLLLKIPVALFTRSLKESEETPRQKSGEGGKKEQAKLDVGEVWFHFKQGNWIVWVAAVPVVLIVLAVLLYLSEAMQEFLTQGV